MKNKKVFGLYLVLNIASGLLAIVSIIYLMCTLLTEEGLSTIHMLQKIALISFIVICSCFINWFTLVIIKMLRKDDDCNER
jgi:hypothetical protein